MGDRRGHVATSRGQLVETLARGIAALEPARGVRIAIDGVDAAGKTTLADELAPSVRAHDVEVVRVNGDDFLRSPEERYRRGRESPEGYYEDSFDIAALHTVVAQPTEGVVLVDGIFLLRPELRDLWHYAIFVSAAREVIVERAVARDGGDEQELRRLYDVRYLPAQIAYMRRERPHERANVVIDNSDAERPRVLPVGATGEALELLEGVLGLDAADRARA